VQIKNKCNYKRVTRKTAPETRRPYIFVAISIAKQGKTFVWASRPY